MLIVKIFGRWRYLSQGRWASWCVRGLSDKPASCTSKCLISGQADTRACINIRWTCFMLFLHICLDFICFLHQTATHFIQFPRKRSWMKWMRRPDVQDHTDQTPVPTETSWLTCLSVVGLRLLSCTYPLREGTYVDTLMPLIDIPWTGSCLFMQRQRLDFLWFWLCVSAADLKKKKIDVSWFWKCLPVSGKDSTLTSTWPYRTCLAKKSNLQSLSSHSDHVIGKHTQFQSASEICETTVAFNSKGRRRHCWNDIKHVIYVVTTCWIKIYHIWFFFKYNHVQWYNKDDLKSSGIYSCIYFFVKIWFTESDLATKTWVKI